VNRRCPGSSRLRCRELICPGLPAAGALGLLLLVACGPSESPPPTQRGAPPSASSPSRADSPVFEEVAERTQLEFSHQLADGQLDNIMESDGAGGAALDFDGDGFLDVYFVNSGPAPVLSEAPASTPRWPNRLLRNRGDGTFEEVTKRAGVEGRDFGTTAAAADYDNDGDTDLLVVNFGSLILYQNQGDRTFKDVTAAAGLTSPQAGISATFFDADRDGRLDLFVANYLKFDPKIKVEEGSKVPYPGPLAYEAEFNLLFHNRGDGTFEDISERAGIRIPGHRAMSVTPLDYDLDGDTDLYVSNDGTANLMLVNDGQGRFKDVGLQTGAGLNQFGTADGSMGAAVADGNGDGLPDLFVTRFGKASFYVNSRGGFFEDRIQASGILEVSSRFTGWGGNFLDFDNDGDQDVFIVNGHAHFLQGMPPLLLENLGEGNFKDASARAGTFFATRLNARGSGALDFDNDGRMDLVLTTLGDQARLLHNVSNAPGHWLKLKLVGTRSNRDGFGALVKLTAAGRTWTAEMRCPTSYVFQQDSRLHFGLGAATRAEGLEIRWPSGQTQTLTNVAADQILQIKEP
jgi:hypothetical protein